MKTEEKRISYRVRGLELERLREVQELLALGSETQAAQYLQQRGLEAIGPALINRRFMKRLEQTMAPQELLPFMEKLAAGAAAGPVLTEGGGKP